MTLFHVSPAGNRDSIAAAGLRAASPEALVEGGPVGVYCCASAVEAVTGYARDDFENWDVYEVEADGLEVIGDVLWPDGWIVLCSLPPERVRRIGTAAEVLAGAVR